jgi:hypothetical protein
MEKCFRATFRTQQFVLVVMAFLVLLSAVVVAYDFHDDLKTRLDCAICELNEDLSSGSSQEYISLSPPQLLELAVVPETSIGERVVFVRSIAVPRAPPA